MYFSLEFVNMFLLFLIKIHPDYLLSIQILVKTKVLQKNSLNNLYSIALLLFILF